MNGMVGRPPTILRGGACLRAALVGLGFLFVLCPASSALECNDLLDNDGDGDTDLADSDCTDAADPFEGVGVLSLQKISDTQGYLSDPGSPGTNPGGLLADLDNLGESAGLLGDLDGDGVPDLTLGAPFDDDGAMDAGASYVLFLNADGTVKARQKISNTEGGLGPLLATDDLFGLASASIGDLDGDGVDDLLVGAHGDDAEGTDAGAAYVLFLNADGTVKNPVRLNDAATGDLSTILSGGEFFGISAAGIGDLNGDTIPDLIVGAHRDDTLAANAGAAYLFIMNRDGSAKAIRQLLPSGVGGNDRFGLSMARLGDLDGDGLMEIAIGSPRDDDGGTDRGAVYILSLRANGTIASEAKISDTAGGFTGVLADVDSFGHGVARLGDLDGDGVVDLAVGANGDDDPATNTGSVWILFLNADGSVKTHRKLDGTGAPLASELGNGDQFGNWLSALGDVDGDGVTELVSTARFDDDGGTDRGAAYVLFLDGQPAVCGDGVLDPLEECDDGNTASLDTCSDSCEIEDVFFLSGTVTTSGTTEVVLDGVTVGVASGLGEPGAQVLQALASAIGLDPTLAAAGVSAAAVGEALYATGTFTETGGLATAQGLVRGTRTDLQLTMSSLEIHHHSGATIAIDQGVTPLAFPAHSGGGFTLPASIFSGSGTLTSPVSLSYSVSQPAAVVCVPGVHPPLSLVQTGVIPPPISTTFTFARVKQVGGPGLRCNGGALGGSLVSASWTHTLFGVGTGGDFVTSIGLVGGVAGEWTQHGATFTSFFASLGTLPSTFETERWGDDQRHRDGVGSLSLVVPTNVGRVVPATSQERRGAFAVLNLHFVPEPGAFLMLSAGGLLLLLLGSRRRKKGP